MLSTMNLTVACCLCMVVIAISPCCCEHLGDPTSIVRPTRPKSFSSPDDLRLYLDQLGEYFAVVGRPRFGKRTIPTESKPVLPKNVLASYAFPPQPALPETDFYDILQYYQPQQQE